MPFHGQDGSTAPGNLRIPVGFLNPENANSGGLHDCGGPSCDCNLVLATTLEVRGLETSGDLDRGVMVPFKFDDFEAVLPMNKG